ncbi:TrbI/VirB10 family protein [Sphingobium phenoxybenzoativorans]|uniref:TrbI/VirB10 family protein n=2 Tax=Sphingobium phenoxybenzoativorans TaxID=1592790 RepID=A0A975K8Y6_9SPHN|nr:TrbI/VirB10 family protein [Sphingobium phenoxybenzoativorans]QUT06950.1 TrbI/VirB10 family protein [Sphingobium phenoxybenzoativorans]
MTSGPETPSAQEPEAPPKKADPETLALRAQPARAIRFNRKAIIGFAAFGSVGLAGIAYMALWPSSHHRGDQAENLSAAAKAPADAISGLPSTYGDAPRLGPPLPGDLGRPILEHQRAMAREGQDGAMPEAQETREAQAAMTERDRRAAERKAARESGLMAQTGSSTSSPVYSEPVQAALSIGDGTPPALDADRDPNAQQRKADFMAKTDKGGDINPHQIKSPSSPNILSAGSVISASLITGLRSDLPGLVTAQVTERVYDSATGSILLVPQGARLIGSYDSVIAFGQSRALLVWQRIIFPDGRSLQLDNVPATDPSGYAGLADKVDFHTWSLLKGVAISTMLGVGANLTFSGESDLVQAIRESTQQNVSRAGDQITSRNLGIQPTITIRPGAPVRLLVHRDLVLTPWKERS